MIEKPHARPDLSDIHFTSWVDRWLPKTWRPYARLARLDRPVGTWLTLLPCLAALVQAADGMPTPLRLAVFSLGTLIMRSAGSTANDIADRKFDAHVERTRFRPLASGQLRTRQGLAFLLAELALAAALLIFLNPLSRWLAVGLLPIVFIYPLCKRFTYWPQVPLGAAFNWGMLMAWSDTKGIVPLGAIVMWAGAIAWQVGYDTIYAYVDAVDDRKLKLRSTAILFGKRGREWIGVFYFSTVLLWAAGGWLLSMSAAYFWGMLVLAAHLAWQAWRIDVDRPDLNFKLFRANLVTGVILLGSTLVGTLPLFK
ncbi:4-hydroxybenzoate octaprenyltransferase [Burkholderia pseudomallei]|uniref:4-hydroxybenzoate octaprenyltransferase n=1 Tax=Burkholderia pseudomallei TaxID=28450 RepID=UPI00155FFC0D|nr:4-hydroxybenzoate octaprenyltransferase [Burkholderia pseudomallei]NRE31729.1 4-hydroxybenzoate octaprenyltransferase [Burkholderia pseudomallei]